MTSNGTFKTSSSAQLNLLAKLVQLYVRSRLRGSTRLTYLLAQRFGTLQHVPLAIPGWAPVYVDLRLPNAHFMLMETPHKGLWRELDEVEIMRQFVRAGDVAFDIGANVGLHSILLSRLVGPKGKLCTFEPNAELLHALEFTIEQLGNATLYPIALSNKDAESQLFIPPDDTVASLADWTIASPKFNQDGPSHVIACVERRLDDLIEAGLLPQPDFIKCDVEGAELRVFEGGRRTLSQVDAPIVLFEANECASRGFGVGVSAAKDFLTTLKEPRYRFFEVHAGGKLAELQEVNPSFSNILAVPESKVPFYAETSKAIDILRQRDNLQASSGGSHNE